MLPKLIATLIKNAENPANISAYRKTLLDKIAIFINQKIEKSEPIKLNFICTENSRRSHLSQFSAAACAHYFGIDVQTFSGGTKVSACNPRTVAALQRAGFALENTSEGNNPKYTFRVADDAPPIVAYSKLYDAPENPQDSFIAIMVCGHADENCPFIPTAERRFALTFVDPKIADNTPEEAAAYDAKLIEIGSQFYYLFEKVKEIAK